jgi:diguanylate cyclase (GGDEF)-like protein
VKLALESVDGSEDPGLVFFLKDLTRQVSPKLLAQADLTLPLSAEGLAALNRFKEIVAQNRELGELSVKDPMTSLYNYRFFEMQLQVEMDRVKRSGRPCCLMMIDLDRFKPVNDRFGHQAGNEVLQTVARILIKEVRKVDIVTRYGGDEFAVILPDTSASRASMLAERIRLALLSDPQVGGYGVSASFGLASNSFGGMDGFAELVEHADQAMYQAKREGGNQVRVHEEAAVEGRATQVTAQERDALMGNKAK